MKNYERQQLEAAVIEMKQRALLARSYTGMAAEKHGETSPEAQRYAWEACAFEDSARCVERALNEIFKHNAERMRPDVTPDNSNQQ